MKTQNRILLSPDDGTQGGTTPPSAAAGVFAETPAAPTPDPTPDPAPTTVTPPAAPAPAGLTEEQLTKILNGAVKAAQPAAPAQTFSQDDFDRTFNVFKPNKELLNAIRAGDEEVALGAIAQMVLGAVKQSTTMSAFQMQQLKDEILGQVNPALSYVQQQSEKQLKDDFFGVHKDLAPYEPLVMKVVADLQSKGTTPSSKDAAFKLVSEETRKLLKSIPGLTIPASAETSGSPAPQPSKMSTLTSGGQGGAGGSTTPAKSKSPGMAVWD